MKQKTEKQAIYWLKIAVIGIVLGFALQFVRAWTDPGVDPPNGNLGAPINTGNIDQTKGNATSGKISAADFCLNSDPTKCLSTVVGSTPPVCNNDGTCDAGDGETTVNCPSDCPPPPPPPPCQCTIGGVVFCGSSFEIPDNWNENCSVYLCSSNENWVLLRIELCQ